ncbi:hypothetical protein C9374_005331 [Naegleria lovaniensis]|uniref:PX domain-containing protein n=1 Tax=Naegleria lovaniensis TaxID=51637 RepID=A0AA88GP75_NAELO|nr:uncharacterized protein C9374_005331 [Naegleria lovaniensis]KAG2382751.1 hypothetical protein C9374_005331 [Naegleria lovaniensis]
MEDHPLTSTSQPTHETIPSSDLFELEYEMIYNNVHYLSDPLILTHIVSLLMESLKEKFLEEQIASFSQPSTTTNSSDNEKESSRIIAHEILKFRLVCKSWKKVIDTSFMPTLVIPHLKKCLHDQEQSVTDGTAFTCFRIPAALLFVFAFGAGHIGDHVLESYWNTNKKELGKVVARASFLLSIYTFRTTMMFLQGNPVVLPAVVAGVIVDQAIEQILKYRNKSKLANKQHSLAELEENMKYANSCIQNCEIVKTMSDRNSSKNKHSCFYVIRVTLKMNENELKYKLYKKYTDFRKLYDLMCQCVKQAHLLEEDDQTPLYFPEKQWIESFLNWRPEEVIEQRKKVFSKMLNLLVNQSAVYDSCEIMKFFSPDHKMEDNETLEDEQSNEDKLNKEETSSPLIHDDEHDDIEDYEWRLLKKADSQLEQ